MKVILLAGGYGTRLSEETVVKPKPMVEIGDKPILWHIMKTYAHFDFNEFIVALGYKGHLIKQYFRDYLVHSRDISIRLGSSEIHHLNDSREDWSIDLCDTGRDTLTGGRLLRLRDHLSNEPSFMLTYGDGVANVDIQKLLEFHNSHGRIATVTAVRPPARFGALVISENQVKEFKEKPQIGEGWINGGYFIFNQKIFDYLQGDQTVLEQSPLEDLAREGELMAYQHEGFWQPMDTVRDRDLLNDLWSRGEAPWKVWT